LAESRDSIVRFILCTTVVRVVVIFFFFQEEDGIRDWSVTGVQTCALPIFARPCNRNWTRRTDCTGGQTSAGWRRKRSAIRSWRRSEERRRGKRVDLGGRRSIKKKRESRE